MFGSWIGDARYAARRLRARPAYALLATLTLALGVGGRRPPSAPRGLDWRRLREHGRRSAPADVLPSSLLIAMTQRPFAARAFLVGGMLFLLSAAIPVFRGQRSNTVFLALAIALLLVGAGIARKARRDP